jgi:hypothetical protein
MGSAFSFCALFSDRFRTADPAFNADFAIHGIRLGEPVIDRGPQSVQRDFSLTIPFCARDLSAAKSA